MDEFDFWIIEKLLSEPEATSKSLARVRGVDQRTVSKRIQRMIRDGVFTRLWEVDWTKLGLAAHAFVGSTTAVGDKAVANLIDMLRSDPRIIEAYETVGTHEYLMIVVTSDLPSLRDSVLRDLEPLTSNLDTSVVARELKKRDQVSLIRFLMETRFPRTRAARKSQK